MQAVQPLNVVVSTLVRQAGGSNAVAEAASNALEQREAQIAANLREYAARYLTTENLDALFTEAGLTFRPAVDPAIAQATARIERAEAELSQARADLDRVSR